VVILLLLLLFLGWGVSVAVLETDGPARLLVTGLVGVAPLGVVLLLQLAHAGALRQVEATRDRLRAALVQARADQSLLATFSSRIFGGCDGSITYRTSRAGRRSMRAAGATATHQDRQRAILPVGSPMV
jgi:hypothetical protein